MIIGLTGTFGAGKGTIAQYLKNKGFKYYSVRDFLTEEIRKRGLPLNRDSMVIVANDLRAKYGSSYIVEQLYKKAEKENANCVIESIRTPGEAEALKKKDRFLLVAVDADVKLRYNRILKRGTETDFVTFDQFVENEKREMQSDDPNKQNISKCMRMADFTIINNGTFEDLYNKVEEILK